MRLALWQIGGDRTWLDRALDDADNTVSAMGLFVAFNAATVDDLILDGLVHAAQRDMFHSEVCGVFAKLGSSARQSVARLGPPPNPDAVHAQGAFHEARWRTGLIYHLELATALQPLLATDRLAWKPYVAADVNTPMWSATIRSAIASETARHAIEALISTGAGVWFLPELLAAGHDDAVEALWSGKPREQFWTRVQAMQIA